MTRAARLAPFASLLVCGLLVAATFETWADPWIDTGQQLEAAARVARGDVLYRDLAWTFGPLSVYFNATLFRLFGPQLSTIFAANLCLFALLLSLLYALCRSIGDRFGAVVATCTVAIVCGFSSFVRAAGYNFMCPYSHELTHGLLIATGALLAASRFAYSGRSGPLALAGALVGLAFLTKPEVLLGALLGVTPFLAVRLLAAREREALLRRLGVLALAGLAPPLLALLGLSLAMQPQDAWTALWTPHLSASSAEVLGLPFYRRGIGLDAPARQLGRLLLSLGSWLAAFGPLVVGALLQRSARGTLRAAGVALLLAPPVLLGAFHARVPWFAAASALPVLCLSIVVGAASCWGTAEPAARRRLLLAAGIGALSLGFLSKMILNARFFQYGFVLAFPATAVVAATLLGVVPRWIAARGGAAAAYRAAATLVFALGLLSCLQGIRLAVASRNVRVEAPGGTFFTDDRGRTLQATLDHVLAAVPPTESVLVVPEGAMVNFLARRRGSLWSSYMPPFALGASGRIGEDAALADLQRRPPDHLLFVDSDLSEYGFRQFGADYAPRVGEWLRSEYEPVWRTGPLPSGGTSAVIGARRRAQPVAAPPPRSGESPWTAWLRAKP